MSWVFVTSKINGQKARKYFEDRGQYDMERKVTKYSTNEVMIPLQQELAEKIISEQSGKSKISSLVPFEGRVECMEGDILNTRQGILSPREKLKNAIVSLLHMNAGTFDELLPEDIPSHWEQHGDLILLPENSFTSNKWRDFGGELWRIVAKSLGVTRLAKKSTINNDGFRTPKVTLLLGEDEWVTHTDNGIKYTFDVTKCMFSSGNITEKMRVGNFDCSGQTVVDLYAGIGYFVLPYLVHAKAAMVHACEWNENAVEALRRNLKLNGVDKQCVIHEGDNLKFPLQGVADHVNLGLIPSSEAGWPVACAALNSDRGGWLHIHGNVTSGVVDHKGNGKTQDTFLPSRQTEEADMTSFHDSLNDNCGFSEQDQHSSTCCHPQNTSMCVVNQGHEQDNNIVLTKSSELEPSLISAESIVVSSQSDLAFLKQYHLPSCNKKVKQEWLDWAKYVAHTLLHQLRKLHGKQEWNVQVEHIEHVKSYAPHVDHLVLDVKCHPLCGYQP
ncbi:tRNA wybutosine-synthesizing protein 2 homolog [Stylophora pistillata]|uniref:tRNA(Phe) (4-demethylwyosine(37)-C(7)) aminocarboxypropyltransferase n=1 Tax=Stylophora pistillata TaxID=50429 RepID=A0A2B4RKR8_STYPI|nr:tRNA wybutosine-synthesizing protein 2 homolog [Stylophora pistillata]PFX16865.1 tRNA wybutosine-synthesizing protein 2-like [Stylophora pistillata]